MACPTLTPAEMSSCISHPQKHFAPGNPPPKKKTSLYFPNSCSLCSPCQHSPLGHIKKQDTIPLYTHQNRGLMTVRVDKGTEQLECSFIAGAHANQHNHYGNLLCSIQILMIHNSIPRIEFYSISTGWQNLCKNAHNSAMREKQPKCPPPVGGTKCGLFIQWNTTQQWECTTAVQNPIDGSPGVEWKKPDTEDKSIYTLWFNLHEVQNQALTKYSSQDHQYPHPQKLTGGEGELGSLCGIDKCSISWSGLWLPVLFFERSINCPLTFWISSGKPENQVSIVWGLLLHIGEVLLNGWRSIN